jgi:two-component system, NtrC family, response regulator AtoC
MRKHILIVDDEPSIRKVLGAHLRRDGYDVTAAASGVEAIEILQEEGADLVITDLRMPNMDGLELLRWVKQSYPGLPVIMLTAHGTVDSAVEALKRGAQDYLTKPFDQDELRLVILKALAQEEKSRRSLRSDEAPKDAIVGDTATIRAVFALIDKVASSPSTVLLTGESGTGKELVARAIHHASARREAPFVTLNCGAIPENLFESELFGHERGAFTGAVTSKPGRFEIADGGTLFLDEIAELPKDLQVKLLRVLQDQTFERVGGIKTIKVDVRLVAATNSDLRQAVASGAFREDLFYRLNVVPIVLPPLRDRVDDIPLLVHHFLQKFNRRLDKHVQGISPAALVALKAAPWPGNIRELENLIERAVLLSDGGTLDVNDFPGILEGGAAATPVDEASDELGLKEYVRVHTARLERARIKKALQQEEGNVTRASRLLGISRKSLQTKMKEYGLREE